MTSPTWQQALIDMSGGTAPTWEQAITEMANQTIPVLDETISVTLAANTTPVVAHRHITIPRGVLRGMVIEAGIPGGTAGGAKTVKYAVGSTEVVGTTLDGTEKDVMNATTATTAATAQTTLQAAYVGLYYPTAGYTDLILNLTGEQADASKSAGTCTIAIKVWAFVDGLIG